MKNYKDFVEEVEEGKFDLNLKDHDSYWGKRYYHWFVEDNPISGINLANMIGTSWPDLCKKYLPTIPEQYRTTKFLLGWLGLGREDKDGYIYPPNYWSRYIFLEQGVFYIDLNNTIQWFPPIKKRKKKKGTRAERLKKFYETQAARRKSEREHRKRKEEKAYIFKTQKELKDKQESLQKLISHGFDPVTSFRNAPLKQTNT